MNPNSIVPKSVRDLVGARLIELHADRVRVVAALDKEIAELEQFLGGAAEQPSGPPSLADLWQSSFKQEPSGRLAAIKNNRVAMDTVVAMLRDGSVRPRDELYEAVLAAGATFTSDEPLRRFTQLLSSASILGNIRGEGWYLKSARQEQKEKAPEDEDFA